MANYKKAFEILKDKCYLMDAVLETYDLTNEEDEVILDCLNAEEDSIEKIIEEFNELEFDFIKGSYIPNQHIEFKGPTDIIIDIKNGIKTEEFTVVLKTFEGTSYGSTKRLMPCYLSFETLQLINRILRLWGVEI